MDSLNYKLFLEREHYFLEKGEFCGETVERIEDIDIIIGEKLGYSKDYVKRWRYKNDKKPKGKTLRKLEELMGCSLCGVDNYTQYAKENINKAYSLMCEYINSQEVGEEDRLGQLWCEFEKLKAGIPKEIYKKMEDFMTEYFDPMIWNFEPEITQEFLDCINETKEKLSEFCENEITPIVSD